MSKYQIRTADGLHFEIGSDELDGLDIIENADGSFHLIYENRSFNVEVLEFDHLNKSYVLNVNEKEISLFLKDELDLSIEKMGFSKKAASTGGKVFSPMPGQVIRVAKSSGDQVEEGETLLILEAMKMENVIKAVAPGLIRAVHVREGDTVAKQQLLIEIE